MEVNEISTILLPVTVLLPFLGAISAYILGLYSKFWRNLITITVSGTCLALILYFFNLLQNGILVYGFPELFDYGLRFRLDKTGFLFAFVISLVWFLTTIYLSEYIKHEKHQNRFYFFILITLGGSLGTVMSGELFGLYIFFEIMSISAYVLIIHKEDKPSLKAAQKYLFMAVTGGLFLIMGIIFVSHYAGTLSIKPLAAAFSELGSIKYFIGFLFMAGFGIKAGMFPVHIWLPEAHPVAPTPASALLSGVMIKAGVYGLLRTVNLIFTPEMVSDFSDISSWQLSQNFGFILLWLGLISMFLGGILALFQKNMKKILAYSSVSQVGYIIMGLGVAAYMGSHGAIGIQGALYHVLNHALFKSSLFLIVGKIYYETHELNIYKLGGIYRKRPLTTLAFIISMAGITGIPGFNGYISKTILHESLLEAYHLYDYRFLYFAEKAFKLCSYITVIYFLKLLIPVFFGNMSEKVKNMNNNSRRMLLSYSILSIFVIIIGIFPNFFLERFINPVLTEFSFEGSGLGHGFVFKMKGIKKALSTGIIGVTVFIILNSGGFFILNFPRKFSLEHLLYRPIIKVFFGFSNLFVLLFDKKFDETYERIPGVFSYISRIFINIFDKKINTFYEKTPILFSYFSGGFINIFDKRVNEVYQKTPDVFTRIVDYFMRVFDFRFSSTISEDNSSNMNQTNNKDISINKKIKTYIRKISKIRLINYIKNLTYKFKRLKRIFIYIYKKQAKSRNIYWDIKNLDFELYVVVFVLLLLFIFFFPEAYML
ncbi:MAG: complex I subunit 5 family protein [Bacillota bacterium]